MKMNGAQLTIALIEQQGIRTIAGIPGGANLPLYDALSRSEQIKHVLARHEQGAGFMAQGMARTSGKPAVCFATSGPGATNILTAIADAKLDSCPVVCVTGQVPSAMIGTDAFQEVDVYGMTVPITKHNFLVRDINDLFKVIPQAFHIAGSGRPGPVVVDIPKDVQVAEVEFDVWPEHQFTTETPDIILSDLEQAADMINRAKKPVLYLGGGIIHASASTSAVRFAEKSNIPVTTTLMALGAIDADHPLNLGMLGMHGAQYTNYILEECDLLIAAGSRFDDRATGKVATFCPNAEIVHIDIDKSEINKIKPASIGIKGDVEEVIREMTPMIDTASRESWMIRVNELKAEFPLFTKGDGHSYTPYCLIRTVADIVGRDAYVSTDVGQHQMWVAQVYPFRFPRQLMTSGGLGTMGFGFPTAIGAALQNPDRTVVCFSGDGSFLMNIQELMTAVEENLNVKIILLNNKSLGLVRQQQDLFYNKNYFASEFNMTPDFVTVAKGFGMNSVDIGTEEDKLGALETALTQPGPCLIHVPINKHEQVLPMVPPGASNKDMIGGSAYVCHNA